MAETLTCGPAGRGRGWITAPYLFQATREWVGNGRASEDPKSALKALRGSTSFFVGPGTASARSARNTDILHSQYLYIII